MSLHKNNRPALNLWLSVIAGVALILSSVYTAWQLSEHVPKASESAKSSAFYVDQNGVSEPVPEGVGITSTSGDFALTQRAAPVLDVLADARDASLIALPKVQSKQSVGVDAELVDEGLREIVMEPAAATVTLNGVSVQLEPNAIGCFPRMLIATKGHASVLVSYPNATPGDPLVIQCEDGGTLDNGIILKRMELDAAGRVSFQFSAGVPEGIYRVLLRKGLDEKHLEFWAGPELALKSVLSRN
jgi:hypothetical protein